MKSIQLIKQLNNTELGKGGTHETYILIPQDLDVSDLFEEINKEYTYKDKRTGKSYTIRLTSAREKRIVGMGPYYTANNVVAGDQVLLEKRVFENGKIDYFIEFNRTENTVYFQKVKNFFELLNTEVTLELNGRTLFDPEGRSIKIEYHGEIQKRKDSPSMTKVYNISIDGNNIQNNYYDRDMIGIYISNDNAKLMSTQAWKKYIVEVKE